MSKVKLKQVRSETYKVVHVDRIGHSATTDIIRMIFGSLRAGEDIIDKEGHIIWEDVSEVELVFDYKGFQALRKAIDSLNKWLDKEREKQGNKEKQGIKEKKK